MSVVHGRRTRAEQVRENRAAVLAAAGEVFRERGYVGATLELIAERAGFSKGVVYSQFASKADLFLTLLEQRIEDRAATNREVLERIRSAGWPGPLGLGTVVSSRSDPAWRLAVIEFRVVAARDDTLRRRYAAAHRRTVDELAEVVGALLDVVGVEPAVPLPTLATALLALDAGTTLEDVVRTEPLTDEEAIMLMLRLAMGDAAADGGAGR